MQEAGSVSEANKSIFRRFVEEVVGRGDLGAVDELLGEGFVEHGALLPDLPTGREGAKRQYALLHAAFPDLEVSLEDTLAEGDRVAGRSVWRGTRNGSVGTGADLNIHRLKIVRIQKGRIVEHWGDATAPGLLQASPPKPGE